MTPTLDRDRLASLLAHEEDHFRALHPRSVELHERARASLLGGVPMVWMVRWAGRVPLFVAEAAGARIRDVDGHEYVDLCLGDTGAMAGHSPPATVAAIGRAAAQGITTMLPTEDAIWVGEELTASLRLAELAADAHRDRCQSLRPAHRAACDQTAQGPGLRRLLPRHAWTSPSSRCCRTVGRGSRPGSVGPPRRPGHDDPGGRMERPGCAGGSARARRRCRGARRAGDDQRRHRAARIAGYHLRIAGADPAARGRC